MGACETSHNSHAASSLDMNGTINTLMLAHRHQTNHYIKNGVHRSPQQNDMICKQRRQSSHDGAKSRRKISASQKELGHHK